MSPDYSWSARRNPRVWMIRYRPLLNDSEFTKFVILLRDLGPFVVVLIDSESRSRRRDRHPAIGRQNIVFLEIV